jgi:hypothetical protein
VLARIASPRYELELFHRLPDRIAP